MALDEKKRQKKRMKKRQKDKARKKQRAESTSFGTLSLRKKILEARNFPIYECLINPSWKENGLASILISRRQPDGNLLFGTYLVDVNCLGLKSTFCNADLAAVQYSTQLRNRIFPNEKPAKCSIPLAHHIIYGGIEFAAQYGFRPDKDFNLSQYVLEDKDSLEPCEEVEFGKDGQPLFIAGPDDNVPQIMGQLEKTAGKGNFKFIVGTGELDPDADW